MRRLLTNRVRWVVLAALLAPLWAWADLQFDAQTVVCTPGPLDTQVVGQYHFTNTGTTPAKISLQTSCGCTTAALPKAVYAPGETGTITATFTFSRAIGSQEQRKQIYVTAETPKETAYVLNLVVAVPEYVQITPAVLTWELQEPALPKTATVKVMTADVIHVVGATISNNQFKIELKTVTAGHEYQVLVTPVAAGQRAASNITVQTDFPPAQPFSFGFFAHVAPPPAPVVLPWYERLLAKLFGQRPGK